MKIFPNILLCSLVIISAGCTHQLYPVPPTGWVLYCQDNPSDPGCADYTSLDGINAYVNGNVTYQPEPVNEEVWKAAAIGGSGDCEDYALAKRAALLAAGWPVERLHLATCIMETGESHVVLIVDLGQRWVVLDNRHSHPMDFESVPYRWLAVQFEDRWLNYQYR